MSATIHVTEGKNKGAAVPLKGKSIFEIGSAPNADLRLDDQGVAGVHLKIYVSGSDYSIFDVSGQGFLHNGKRTLKAPVGDGDEIQVGQSKLRLAKEAQAGAIMRAQPPAPKPAPAAPTLQAVKGNDAGKTYDLRQKEMFIIGRGVATDITVWDIRVSRVHCRIDHDEDGYLVTDLNASNGTYVNGQKIETHRLKPGDEIKVGSTVYQYQQ